MTLTLYWAFAILTFVQGGGASCGVSLSPEYENAASCEEARAIYEGKILWYQTPTRRVSTLPCEMRGR